MHKHLPSKKRDLGEDEEEEPTKRKRVDKSKSKSLEQNDGKVEKQKEKSRKKLKTKDQPPKEEQEEEEEDVKNEFSEGSASDSDETQRAKENSKSTDAEKERTVFVGKMNKDTTADQITAFFSPCGDIEKVKLLKYSDSKKPRGSAFVRFSSASEAEKALELNGKKLEGALIRVDRAENKPPHPDHMSTVYVGNLNFKTNERQLFRFFKKVGEIHDIYLPRFKDSGLLRGFAMVRFKHPSAVTEALKFDGKMIDGRAIRVQTVADNRGTKEFKEPPKHYPNRKKKMERIKASKKRFTKEQ